MRQSIIENSILNSLFDESGCRFKFSVDGITDEVVTLRRSNAYFIPIAQPEAKLGTANPRPFKKWLDPPCGAMGWWLGAFKGLDSYK